MKLLRLNILLTLLIILSVIFLTYSFLSSITYPLEGLTPATTIEHEYPTAEDTDESEIAAANKQLDDNTDSTDTTNLHKSTTPGATPVTDLSNYLNLPLREFAIKASYNSAYDGNKVTLDALANVIGLGYRFIDLHVFEAATGENGTLYVGYSKDRDSPTADLSLKLTEVLSYINSFAFQLDTRAQARIEKRNTELKIPFTTAAKQISGPSLKTNYTKYPFILNFRITQRDIKTDIITKIYNLVRPIKDNGGILTSKNLHVENDTAIPVTKDTPLSAIMGKFVVSMDIDNILRNYTTSFDANDVPTNVRSILHRFVNIKTGGHSWRSFNSYEAVNKTPNSPLFVTSDGTDLTTNAKMMYIVYPSITDTSNPDTYDFIVSHKIQTIPCRNYILDGNLAKYNKLFNDKKSPFVPLNTVLHYLK